MWYQIMINTNEIEYIFIILTINKSFNKLFSIEL